MAGASGAHNMNTVLTKTVPPGDFEEISIQMPDWPARFLNLIQEGKPVKYDIFTMPNLSKEILEELGKRGYYRVISESDKDQHFLIPKSK